MVISSLFLVNYIFLPTGTRGRNLAIKYLAVQKVKVIKFDLYRHIQNIAPESPIPESGILGEFLCILHKSMS